MQRGANASAYAHAASGMEFQQNPLAGAQRRVELVAVGPSAVPSTTDATSVDVKAVTDGAVTPPVVVLPARIPVAWIPCRFVSFVLLHFAVVMAAAVSALISSSATPAWTRWLPYPSLFAHLLQVWAVYLCFVGQPCRCLTILIINGLVGPCGALVAPFCLPDSDFSTARFIPLMRFQHSWAWRGLVAALIVAEVVHVSVEGSLRVIGIPRIVHIGLEILVQVAVEWATNLQALEKACAE